ncbi:hypothetical protein F5879DRAFT_809358 [Lentinula edodes]|uniref:uncharacterized protein n=1 Tax=Lentinula edodes TaxID=5353 RepID=UPI001E8ECD0D|nr:uncharacterized protein C8R40DRAFT_1050160 [Lentinula edodes]KAH7873464.1 hypothetical protein C8R40DRAFT_1050160 [Lentinula edodes]KAJ3900358.1 hypothetical protein F5879DRAFT_809358 [Lentinula edodes]KAJ3917096.1 hypothetical protein F5877DRAFT_45326 [Lentinula edodes]
MSVDARKAGESLILIGSLVYASSKIWEGTNFHSPNFDSQQYNLWVLTELHCLVGATVLYVLWLSNSLISSKANPFTSLNVDAAAPSLTSKRPSSPRIPETRDSNLKKNAPLLLRKRADFGFVWMSVPRNYRESSDDGILTGLLFGPLVSSALLYSSLTLPSSATPLSSWRIETPRLLSNAKDSYSALEALVLSRYNLVDLSNLCSTILLFHVCASWWFESRYRVAGATLDSERKSVPRSAGKRLSYFIVFTLGTTICMLGIKFTLVYFSLGIWQHLNWFEITVASLFYQCTLYGVVRLAHRGFTLGELGIVSFGGTALFMEFLNVTAARIWPLTTPYIKTYRLPTPLLIFQTALIAGSFLTGFVLSPFLILSRHIGQRPVRRMRYPELKLRQRRLLALGFYVGSFVMTMGLIGMWTYWCLGKRNPWLWVIFYILEGRKGWSRPALLIYWIALGSLSVAGWNRQLARSRRFRAWNTAGENLIVPGSGGAFMGPPFVDGLVPQSSGNSSDTQNGSSVSGGSGSTMGLTFPNLSNLPNLPHLPNGVATDLLDAADKHVPTLRLNARRKFFHALTVIMFVPGVAFDPAFTHLSFSVAFALFTFAEYVRYFAIYPFGASIHLFMNEFLDQKDGGTAILSHFYLLTGCAGSLWLEGSSPLLLFTGILVLGVGDALASIIGKRIGVHRWSPTTTKTLEGSFAFTLSVVISAWILRLLGVTESFSTLRYTTVIGTSSILEALSDQNDNVTLPLFSFSLLALVGTS